VGTTCSLKKKTGLLLALAVVMAAPAAAHDRWRPAGPGALVSVSVEVDGRTADLFPAVDGSGRHYLEAKRGASYAVTLRNRTGERVGVVLTVDGLNAISGTLEGGGGRMYVLDPWGEATVRGWRTSLREVRRFTFVDETRSYAERTGQSNSRLGWIEVSVYREVRRHARYRPRLGEDRARSAEAAPASPLPSPPEAEGRANDRAEGADDDERASRGARKQASPYPGTGWGSRAHDPVVVVSFDPEPAPTERITLRYEYRDALLALGVLPGPRAFRDRLWERERGDGFAQPPRW